MDKPKQMVVMRHDLKMRKGKIEHTMQRQFLGLARPFFACISSYFCRYIHTAALVPLRKTERQPFRITVIDGTSVYLFVILNRDTGLCLSIVGIFIFIPPVSTTGPVEE